MDYFILMNSRQISHKARCLANKGNDSKFSEALVKFKMPGLIWSVDDQCQMIFGKQARFARVSKFQRI